MKKLIFLLIFLFVSLMLAVVPKSGVYVWDQRIIVPATAAMFTLLVWLVARFIGTDRTPLELIVTASFILLFAPGTSFIFSRDEQAILELGSQCIVPFFLTQYTRISRKNFRKAYVLMLLMGIFCSFTHDGITLPLCLAFLLMAWQRRSEFFRLACWPMVAGWLVGTILQFALHGQFPDLRPGIEVLTSRTAMVMSRLWDTKIFMLALALTMWFTSTHWGRRELLFAFRRNRLIAYGLLFALSCVPFAPLGIENAVIGVCFFAMLWAMLLCKGLERHYLPITQLRT